MDPYDLVFHTNLSFTKAVPNHEPFSVQIESISYSDFIFLKVFIESIALTFDKIAILKYSMMIMLSISSKVQK